MSLCTFTVRANDYLELAKHYSVYAGGANFIHFKVPVWAYGKANNYYLSNSTASYIVLTKDGSGKTVEQTPVAFTMFTSEPYGENDKLGTNKGTAWQKVNPGQGVVVVTSMYNGTRLTINDNGNMEFALIQQVADDGYSYISMLEFDWYPPESLNGKDFVVRLDLNINKSSSATTCYEKQFRFNGPFRGGDNLTSPQLSQPYLYMVNETGATGYGQAAVQYTTFQKPVWYVTTAEPTDTIKTSEQSGTIFINTSDTLQSQFTATFKVYREESVNTTSTITAPAVDIPPYHRIHNFMTFEDVDTYGSYTGNNIISWELKNPELADIIDGDCFEIQRATLADFSDAQTIQVLPLVRNNSGDYTYVDNSFQVKAHTASNTTGDTIKRHVTAEEQSYDLLDDNGEKMCCLYLKMIAKEYVLPSAPMYYRVRRASAAMWGWDHEFAKSDTLMKHNYLAPLSPVQSNYRLDENFDKNRTVHFDIKIDNMEMGYRPISLDKCDLAWRRQHTTSDTVDLQVVYDPMTHTSRSQQGNPYKNVSVYVYATHEGEELYGPAPGKKLAGFTDTLRVPRGCQATIKIESEHSYSWPTTSRTFKNIDDHTRIKCHYYKPETQYELRWEIDQIYNISPEKVTPAELAQIKKNMNAIKQQLLPQLLKETNAFNRCMWDRTARLLLCRKSLETGAVTEIVVPQDSIRRQDDGSWLAHMTDVAGEPCTHYAYSVRIDQNDASIHVCDSSYLQPVAMNGPNLYFDESATITSFTATQGEAQGYHKNGISLVWKPSSAAVDEYLLTRIVKGSDQVPDTILRTVDNNYFDESAKPNVHYEYTVTALYACNGKHTNHSATAEGWRTPYGQISGTILMTDNCGMGGVQVSLSANGQTIRTVTTDATGSFTFDSLTYNMPAGTIYTVTPTSQYGTFSYNHTSSGMASVSLASDRALVSGIDFVNTSSVRLSGRVLYHNTTIPVAGAAFVLNGDTILRNGSPLLSSIDGSFELSIPKSMPCRLQVAKKGHTFLNDGWLFVTGTDTTFSLVKALDGVRFYDMTKVRLVGRVAGGNNQKALKHGFGVGKNNLGDDLQLVLMLEGDNTAHVVHDPNDLTRDTMQQRVAYTGVGGKQVVTNTLFEQKRIIIRPDVSTGEFAVDIFPVKYKVVQATAKGYATLLAAGSGSETFDLSNAPLTLIQDSLKSGGMTYHTQYNAIYDRIYHNPVQVQLTQFNNGMEAAGYGEAKIQASSIRPMEDDEIPMYVKEPDGTVEYLLGYPVFAYNRRYLFMASAYEEYRYNNSPAGEIDRVPQRGGSVTVQNGMSKNTDRTTYQLDSLGRNKSIWLMVDYMDVQSSSTNALRTVSVSLQTEGNTVEATAFRAFVQGALIQPETLQSTEAEIKVLDIVRDPGGNGSSAYVESGTTYKLSYKESYQWKVGLNLTLMYGVGITQDIGVVFTAPAGPGNYIGSTINTKRQLSATLPIVTQWKWGYQYDYSLTTTERISTSSAKVLAGVGANADVFIGTTISQLTGKAKTIALITDSLYQARQPAIQAGVMKVLAQGEDTLGKNFYLVTGEKVVLGSRLENSFNYSQHYILNTIIPNLVRQRQNLLMDFEDEDDAKAMANAVGHPVYWNLRTAPVNMRDTLADEDYSMVLPDGDAAFNDEIGALDNMLLQWLTLVYVNEKEKVTARSSGKYIGTYSVNYGNTYTRSESYSATDSYNELPQNWGLVKEETAALGINVAQGILTSLVDKNSGFLWAFSEPTIGTALADVVSQYVSSSANNNAGNAGNAGGGEAAGGQQPAEGNANGNNNQAANAEQDKNKTLGVKTNKSEWDCKLEPVLNYSSDRNKAREVSLKKNAGFTLVADDQGDITVSVYRPNIDSTWFKNTAYIRKNVGSVEPYGSYVYYTQAGSSFCPYEGEERTLFYNPGTIIGNATAQIAKPELSINTYELTNVPSDQRATFRIELKNGGQVEIGAAAAGQTFVLSFDGTTNPYGAKVFLNGAPLNQAVDYTIKPGQTIYQTIEVEKGQVDDYENLRLKLACKDCSKTNTTLSFSVHFIPESSPVSLAYPRDKWVMNTLSARDSVGYYLPVTIDGFNIHHKNFDHIEFQYKLSTENNEAWVNACSFYADDSLYNAATGNKAKIVNGRIEPFRFYGERDPKELDYDLRAVSFCRYGSDFVTKASPVIRGTKDTRPPVLFGKASPANGILTLKDNISMRFSEPIAGNWLDEDNNFQILGVTNSTGITQSTSLYFDGQEGHYARTKTERELAYTDLSVDMLIKPAVKGREMALFAHGDDDYSFTFSLTADNRLKLTALELGEVVDTKLSKPMSTLSTTDFTRVIMVYNSEAKTIRFYAGTMDITDNPSTQWMLQNYASPIMVGGTIDSTNLYHGNMMELRVWTKPLTPAEISNTHLRHLTGYEYGLRDYYPMNENKGNELTDLATGATLFAKGLNWTRPQGLSLATTGAAVRLQPTLFSRSDAEDYSLLFWFRSTNSGQDTISLFGTSVNDSTTLEIALQNGEISFRTGYVEEAATAALTDGNWHHCALVVSRTSNYGSLTVDGQKVLLFPAIETGALSGTKVWLAKGLKGNIDEVCLFEQPLPDELVREFYQQSPNGEEMGLINLLTFSQLKRNSANVMELVFSSNNQRVFKDANGKTVSKVQPLLLDDLSVQGDKNNSAPLRDRGLLTRLPFTWNYQLSDLLINIKSQPREINKRTMYITVRDVEDLNGNRLPSPVTWTVYVDLNSVDWNERTHREKLTDDELTHRFTMAVSNTTGMTRQFTIEHLPSWLTASPAQGTLEAEEKKTITFTINAAELKIGTHHQVLYLTDDQGLSESLLLEIAKETEPPYTDVDLNRYPFNMSLCGKVLMSEAGKTVVNTTPEDFVYAIYNNECVGVAHCTNNGELYLTVHGNEKMTNKSIRFQLWKAATGKAYNLTPDTLVLFAHGAVYGCGLDAPVQLQSGGSEMQTIALNPGWNWVSTYLDIPAALQTAITAEMPWTEGDLIKNPATRKFCTYSEQYDKFIGTLKNIDYTQMYMVNSFEENIMHLFGFTLPEDSMKLTLQGGGKWTPLSCMFSQVVTLREAMSDYYDHASTGDLIKAQNRFAVFSADRRWVGDLSALTPGEGYLFRRMAEGPVTIHFYNRAANGAPARQAAHNSRIAAAQTNMTMICKLSSAAQGDTEVNAYIGSRLVGVATKIDSLYFLTISSDTDGELRFETGDGEQLVPTVHSQVSAIRYQADSHHGTLQAPVLLQTVDEEREHTYKIFENQHVIIIRGGERYDMTGKKLQ